MSATGAMDMGGKQGAATAAGIINGVGSLGQLISPFAVTYFSKVYGWDGLFYLFVVLAFVAGTLLTFKWKM
jgi:OPA family glycerol-3-phosphate transporter-like MFS transporter